MSVPRTAYGILEFGLLLHVVSDLASGFEMSVRSPVFGRFENGYVMAC